MATKRLTKSSGKTRAPKLTRARTTMTTDTREQSIALRAYQRWEARGFAHGFDVEDWLAAERELD
jgi:hypothetical protein